VDPAQFHGREMAVGRIRGFSMILKPFAEVQHKKKRGHENGITNPLFNDVVKTNS